jgi:hypothetical protein
MPIQYFNVLIQTNSITLQRYYDKRRTHTEENHCDLFVKIALKWCENYKEYALEKIKRTGDDFEWQALETKLNDELRTIKEKFYFRDIYKHFELRSYFCCFYDVNEPSVNLLNLFGGKTGVSVGFNREKLKKHISGLPINNSIDYRYDNVIYYKDYEDCVNNCIGINMTDKFDVNVFFGEDKINGLLENTLELKKLSELFCRLIMLKSDNYKDENEYRIIEIHTPVDFNKPDSLDNFANTTKEIEIDLNLIEKIVEADNGIKDRIVPLVQLVLKKGRMKFTKQKKEKNTSLIYYTKNA